MSDAFLRFVPADPQFQPAAAAAATAERLLSSFLPHAESVSSTFSNQVRFVDPGGNWSGVRCPARGADAEEWWPNAMDAAATSRFENLTTEAPCCRTSLSLHELQYLWPAAFGRYILEAMNPSTKALPAQQVRELEEGLGGVGCDRSQSMFDNDG